MNKKINFEKAVYTEQKINQYKGNPLIEALPDIIDNHKKTAKILTKYPHYDKEDLNLPAMYRIHMVKNIEEFYKPLSAHYEVEQIISRLIRHGYVNRNPIIYKSDVNKYDWQKYAVQSVAYSVAPELGIFGISGIGKTSLVKKILSMYPQGILHTNYNSDLTVRYQITWLHVETPSNCTRKGLCLNLLSKIDEILGEPIYYRKGVNKSTDELPEYIKTVLNLHSVGILVFDELQNLRGIEGKKREQLLNFFVEISNTIQVPIILIGTLKALPLFNGEFRNARRICGDETIIWNRIDKDGEWKAFTTDLFKFQYTQKYVEINEGLMDLLYEESQGITDIVVKLFMLAQYRAISTGKEEITKGIISSVAKDCLKPIQPMLDALKKRDKDALENYEDIYLSKDKWETVLKSEENKAKIYGNNQDLSIPENKNQSLIDNKIIAITSWLIHGGFTSKESETVATEVINNYGANTDTNLLNRYAYELLINKKELQNEKQLIRKKKNLFEPSDILKLYEKANKAKSPFYDVLKSSNYIADINEFIA